MNEVWWGKESRSDKSVTTAAGVPGGQPQLLPAGRKSVEAEIRKRISSFTPEWTRLEQNDAGIAFIRLFGEQMEPVLERVNRLPEKVLVDFLGIAGIEPLAATAARVLLEFKVSEDAPESVLIASGFQVGADAADESGDTVIFETERSLYAAPLKIDEVHTQHRTQFQDVTKAEPFLPFGRQVVTGNALWIGFSGDAEIRPTLSIAINLAAPAEAPPPVPAGGVMPTPTAAPPLLQWDVLNGTTIQPADVVIDETRGLTTSGIVELELPRTWAKGRPAGLDGDASLRWLRLRLEAGRYLESPQLMKPVLNVARAIAARTVRDEVLEPVPNTEGRSWRLSQTPILPGSLKLEIDEGDFFAVPIVTDSEDDTEAQQWSEVPDLAGYGPDDRVYTLDSRTGVVNFGNNVNGAAVPPGFRHISALGYQVGGGLAGAVDPKAASTLISSAPFLIGVENPFAASGGTDKETNQQTISRGPQEIRARARAVTVADYALLARRTQGAQVERAHAVSGLHPSFPGLPIPGVVGVFVVPPDRGEGPPPTPNQETLRAVAEFLSAEAAPAGVEVVAAAPSYQRIRCEVGIFIKPEADAGATVRLVSQTLIRYFHPLKGGDDGNGWPFGGIIRYPNVLRLIGGIDGVRAVPRLNFIVDGYAVGSCHDYPIAVNGLLWPDGNQIIVMEKEDEE